VTFFEDLTFSKSLAIIKWRRLGESQNLTGFNRAMTPRVTICFLLPFCAFRMVTPPSASRKMSSSPAREMGEGKT